MSDSQEDQSEIVISIFPSILMVSRMALSSAASDSARRTICHRILLMMDKLRHGGYEDQANALYELLHPDLNTPNVRAVLAAKDNDQ